MNRIRNDKSPKDNKKSSQKNKKNHMKNQSNQYVISKKEKKKKSFFGRLIKRIFILLLLTIIVCGTIFYLKVKNNGGGVTGALITVLGLSIEDVEDLDTINVLLLGISEDLHSKLTDTIIVCSYNPQTQKASMISIPRDTFIGTNKNKAKGTDKINSLYSKNPEKLLKKVSEITGIELKYYAVVNTKSLIKIVDIIGGVDFEVPIKMDYDDPTQNLHIHLKKGMQKINGEKAEQLLRFRHNNDGSSYPTEYGDNDYGRMKTQRAFITETMKQTINIKNIGKSKSLINAIFENLETNLEKENIIPYIPTIVKFDTENITSVQLPGESEKCNNLWFFIHDKSETKSIIQNLNQEINN